MKNLKTEIIEELKRESSMIPLQYLKEVDFLVRKAIQLSLKKIENLINESHVIRYGPYNQIDLDVLKFDLKEALK